MVFPNVVRACVCVWMFLFCLTLPVLEIVVVGIIVGELLEAKHPLEALPELALPAALDVRQHLDAELIQLGDARLQKLKAGTAARFLCGCGTGVMVVKNGVGASHTNDNEKGMLATPQKTVGLN